MLGPRVVVDDGDGRGDEPDGFSFRSTDSWAEPMSPVSPTPMPGGAFAAAPAASRSGDARATFGADGPPPPSPACIPAFSSIFSASSAAAQSENAATHDSVGSFGGDGSSAVPDFVRGGQAEEASEDDSSTEAALQTVGFAAPVFPQEDRELPAPAPELAALGIKGTAAAPMGAAVPREDGSGFSFQPDAGAEDRQLLAAVAKAAPVPQEGAATACAAKEERAGVAEASKRRPGKVELEKGHSQMDWLRLVQNSPDLAGLQGMPVGRKIKPDEVKLHRTEDDAWTIWRGKVYNISPYMRFHPGGRDMLIKGAGRDCTTLFNKYHSWVNADFLLEKCLIGMLDAELHSYSPE
eukprot:SM000167S02977  [mRNA]  locus=s167:224212:226219:- [translate_table: standard]